MNLASYAGFIIGSVGPELAAKLILLNLNSTLQEINKVTIAELVARTVSVACTISRLFTIAPEESSEPRLIQEARSYFVQILCDCLFQSAEKASSSHTPPYLISFCIISLQTLIFPRIKSLPPVFLELRPRFVFSLVKLNLPHLVPLLFNIGDAKDQVLCLDSLCSFACFFPRNV